MHESLTYKGDWIFKKIDSIYVFFQYQDERSYDCSNYLLKLQIIYFGYTAYVIYNIMIQN